MEELVKELLDLLNQLDRSGYCSYEEIEEMNKRVEEIRSQLSEIVNK